MKKGLLACAIILGLAMCGCGLDANTGRELETSPASPVSDNTMDASAALIRAFSEPAASYYLTSQGIIISIPVPHALGDHLEMAVNYEYLEPSIKKNHPFWDGYMFLAE